MSIAAYLAKLSEGVNSSGILTTSKGGTGTTSGGAFPTITGISYGGDENDTATDTSGGKTVTITGANFAANAKILINGVAAPVVTVVSPSTITFTTPAMAAGTYVLYMVNADGSTAIAVPGISYSGVPVWSTAAGTVATATETQAISGTLSATSNSTVTLSLLSGTLPPGAILNSNGTISGNSQIVSGPTTYTFTIRATDAELQDTDRQFSIVINPDVITFTNPVSSSTVTLNQNESNTVVLAATTVTGNTIASYTANTLPPGMTLTGSTVSGVPTTLGTTSTTLTATSTTTAKTGTSTFTWSVIVGSDLYWKNTTLLLSGTASRDNFVTDYSLNNNQITVFGDTRASPLNPYQAGYYSNFFDGTGDYLTVPSNVAFAFGTGDFTIECWFNTTTLGASQKLITFYPNAVLSGYNAIYINTANKVLYGANGSDQITGTTTITTGTWYHLAAVRLSGVTKLYLNGVQEGSNYTDSTSYLTSRPAIGTDGYSVGTNNYYGSISNLHIVKGTALYTANFTPATTPLTAITNTSLLTCQSARIVDNSTNAFTITRAGDVSVQQFNPFGVPATATVNNLYSTYFDGTGDYLSVADNSAFVVGTGNFTIEGWIYPTQVAAAESPIFKLHSADSIIELRQNTNKLDCFLAEISTSVTTSTGTIAIALNTWNHVAFVRNGTTTYTFVNGVLDQTKTAQTQNLTTLVTTKRIAANQLTNAFFTGHISNLRFVKGTAVYTANFTPPTANLTAIANTSLLTCQDATIRDNSVNAFTITSAGDARPVAQSPFTQTTTTVPLTTVGSAYFDGTGDRLIVPSNSGYSLGTGDFTIEMWVYNQSATNRLISYGVASSPIVYLNASNFLIYENYGTGTILTSTIAAPLNAWNHIAICRASGVSKIFINGIQGASGSDTNNWTQSGNIYLGTDVSTTYMTGYLQDVRVVKGTAVYTANFAPPVAPLTAVTNTQLLTLQTSQPSNNSQFIDNSTAANPITRFGNTTQGSFSPYGANWSNYFDGTGDWLTVPAGTHFQFTGDYTLEAWIYVTILTDGLIFGTANAGGQADQFGYSSTGQFYFANVLTAAGLITTNNWVHVAASRSGTTQKLFVNGVVQSTTTVTGTIGQNLTGYIGRRPDTFSPVNGYISDLRIIKGTALYTANFTPQITPLPPVTNTVLLTCQDARFVDNSANNFTVSNVGDTKTQRFSPYGATIQTPTSYSVQFNGNTNAFTTPYNVVLNLYQSVCTFECWVYLTSLPVTNSAVIYGHSAWDGSSTYTNLLITTAGNLQYMTRNMSAGNYVTSTSTVPINQWAHIAWVRSGTLGDTWTYYINGVAAGTGSWTGRGEEAWNTSMAVGTGNFNNDRTFPGSISNLRVVKGVAVYTGAFTPPTAPLTATQSSGTNIAAITGTATSLLTCQASTAKDNSTNAFAITATGNLALRKFNPFGYTNTQGSAYTPALYGSSAYFDGTGDYLTVPSNAALNFGTGDFTIEVWINPNSLAADWFIASSTGSGGLFFGYRQSSAPQGFGWGRTGVAWDYVTASGTSSVWQHIALTRSGTSMRLFVNGTQVGTTQTLATAYDLSTTNTSIGSQGTTYYLNGYMSDLRITKSRALYTSNFVPPQAPLTPSNSTTLLLNMDKGALVDYTKSVNLETVADAKITTESAYNGLYYSNYFDGTGDYLTVPANNAFVFGTGDFSVELWIYPQPYPTDSYIVNNLSAGNTSWGLEVYTGLIRWVHWSPIILSATAPSVNSWHHVAVTRSGTTISMFIDGVRVATATDSTNLSSNNPVLIGHYPALAYTGNISNLRIVKGTAVYNPALTTCTVPTAPLTAISGTSLLTCQSNKFVDASTNLFAITRTGDVAVRSFNPFQRNTQTSMLFDGTGDALPIPYNSALNLGAGNFTIEFWSYVNATPTTEGYFFSIGPAGSGTANRGLRLAVHNGTAAGIYFCALGIGSETLLGSFPTAGAWNHIAFVRNGTTVTGYVNGIALGTTFNASTTSITDMSAGDYSFVAGLNSSGGTPRLFYNGYLEDLRVTRGVARYTANFTPPSAKLQTK